MSLVGTGAQRGAGAAATVGADEASAEPRRSPLDRPLLIGGGLFALVALPLVVAAVSVRRPSWYPVLDLAMTELRLRDVGSSQTPLIGLPGRIGSSLAGQGSHPGPLSFYLLAPLYRAFGSSAWAMQAATVALHLAALGAALAIAVRRGGARLGVGVAALLVLLIAGYEPALLTQPWNPYLPLLWWVVLLLAVWSVVCGDLALLPVAVAAGTLCAQTHVPYLGLVAGLAAGTVVVVVLAWRRAAPGSAERRAIARWSAWSGALAVVLWLPPIVDQAVNDPGNLRAIYDHLVTPEERPLGPLEGIERVLLHLDLAAFLRHDTGWLGSLPDPSSDPRGSLVPGVVLLAVWALAAAAAVRTGRRPLLRLHLVVALGLLVSVVSTSRIFGKAWYYLTLWAWGVAGLLVLAVGWTAVALVLDHAGPDRRRRLANAATVALAALLGAASLLLAARATDTQPPDARLSETLGAVVPDTVRALERGDGAATGRDGRYLVLFSDALYFGSESYGMVNELERAGFDAGMPDVLHVPITDHRVLSSEDATASVIVASGEKIERWRQDPEAVEVAHVDPRDAADRAESARLRADLIDELRRDGLDDLVPLVDGNLFAVANDPRSSDRAVRWTSRLLELGAPTAVFVAPPTVVI